MAEIDGGAVVGALGKVAKFAVKGVVLFAAFVGMVVIVGVLWLSSGKKSDKAESKPGIVVDDKKMTEARKRAEEARAAEKQKAIDSGCLCGQGVCEGPRGGSYCVTEDNQKRYVKK